MVSRRRDLAFGDCRRRVVVWEVVEVVEASDVGGGCNKEAERERVIRPVSVAVAEAIASLAFLRFGFAPGSSSPLPAPRDVESRLVPVVRFAGSTSGVDGFVLFPE